MVVAVRRADQSEIALIGNDEDDAAIGILKHIGAVVIVELAHHDMRALHQPDLRPGIDICAGCQNLLDPGAAGVNE